MHLYVMAALALLLATVSHARPAVFEESVRITPPSYEWVFFGRFGVAIDGDYALISAERYVDESAPPDELRLQGTAMLYQRSGGTWNYIGNLGPIAEIVDGVRPGLAMRHGVAMVIVGNEARIFELSASGWAQAPVSGGAAVDIQGPDIEIFNDGILVQRTGCDQDSRILRRVNGTWTIEAELSGNSFDCAFGSPVVHQDLEWDHAVVVNQQGINGEPPREFRYRRQANGTWNLIGGLEGRHGVFFGREPALMNSARTSMLTWTRNAGTRVNVGVGYPRLGAQPADGHMQWEMVSGTGLQRIEDGRADKFMQRNWSHDFRAYVYNIFRVDSQIPGNLAHEATLRAYEGYSLGTQADQGNGLVIVSGVNDEGLGDNVVRIFEIPMQFFTPGVQVFDFEAMTASPWQRDPGTAFFVRPLSNTIVYRQASTNGTPASWLPTSFWTNQSIQAEIMLRTYSGTDRWVGLATRRRNGTDYYYAALRTSGRVELNRMQNGVSETLSSVPATLAIGKKVRLRLESIGTLHRVYVDDQLLCSVTDDAIPEGHAGILMHRAAADYDNVVVSPAPFATIYADDFFRTGPHEWRYVGGGWSRNGGGSRLLRQSAQVGFTHVTVGAPTNDQIVQARVRILSSASPHDWAGLLLRRLDDRNHVQLRLQEDDTIALVRRTNDVDEFLKVHPMNVSAGTWYTVRVEVLKGSTRVFVNDQLQFADSGELGPDVSQRIGNVGLATSNVTAEFDDFLAYQP